MNLVIDMLPVLFLLLEDEGVVEEEEWGVVGEFPWEPVAACGSSRVSSRAPVVR